MNELINLQFEGGPVPVIMVDGIPHFLGKDICERFGDSNPNRSLARLSDEDKKIVEMQTAGGTQSVIIITEPGLYNLLWNFAPQKANKGGTQCVPPLILKRIEQLHRFKRWITSEVLPQIRKTGSYGTQKQPTPTELALMVIESEKQKLLIENKLHKAEKRIEVLNEHDQIVKQFMACDGLLSFDEVAKIARIRLKRFYKILQGVVHKNNGQVYANLVATGKVELKPLIRNNKIQTQEFFTPTGAVWFYRKYLRKNNEPTIESFDLDF